MNSSYVTNAYAKIIFITGLSDEERVNFVRPKKSLFKKREKNDTKNRNGQI